MSLSPTCSASTLVRFPDPLAAGSGNLTNSTHALQQSCTVTKKWERHGRAIWRGMLHGKIHMWEAWGWRKCLATTHLLPATTTCHKRQCCSPCNMHPHRALSVEGFFSPNARGQSFIPFNTKLLSQGRILLPNRMNFWKNSKRPFWKIILQFFYNRYGCIYARRHRPDIISSYQLISIQLLKKNIP